MNGISRQKRQATPLPEGQPHAEWLVIGRGHYRWPNSAEPLAVVTVDTPAVRWCHSHASHVLDFITPLY